MAKLRADDQEGGVADGDVTVRRQGRAGILTLGGGRLTAAMRRAIWEALERFGRDPDVYCAILEAAGAGSLAVGEAATHAADLATSCLGVWRTDRFAKPHVTLIAGPVAGAGLGLTLPGTHRVAGAGATFASPEIVEGRLPGVGASFLLPALPGRIGLYMALTGRPIDRSLAYRADLVTHCIDARHFPAIVARLADADPVDQVLDELHETPGASRLDPHLATIERCFSAPTPATIMAALAAGTGPDAGWAREVAAAMGPLQGLALAVTHCLLTRNAQPDLRSALTQDFRVAVNHATARTVDAHFAPIPGGELALPVYAPPPSIP